jgi:hypothetical protein
LILGFKSQKPSVAIVYDATQLYTDTVRQSIRSIQGSSFLRTVFVDVHSEDQFRKIQHSHALLLHYSARPCMGNVPPKVLDQIARFKGPKCMIIQDEYDHVEKTRTFIKDYGIDLVFSCVPETHTSYVYGDCVKSTRFVRVLTGYANAGNFIRVETPTINRSVFCGYRGRKISLRYGELALFKTSVALDFGRFLADHRCTVDFSCADEDRFYGDSWLQFLKSCRFTFGTPSGSNVFDFGTIDSDFKSLNTTNDEFSVYQQLIVPLEPLDFMGQISPRIFEAIECRSALVLLEGQYSQILEPGIHFLELKKDLSNVLDLLEMMNSDETATRLSEVAFTEIIASGRYSWSKFTTLIENEISALLI